MPVFRFMFRFKSEKRATVTGERAFSALARRSASKVGVHMPVAKLVWIAGMALI